MNYASTCRALNVPPPKRQSSKFHESGDPSKRPSGVATNQSSLLATGTSVAINVPVVVQTLMLPSSLAEMIQRPSLLKATPFTFSDAPLNTCISFPDFTSQIFTLRSLLAEASN